MRPNKPTDEFTIKLEKAKNEVEEKQKALKEFSSFFVSKAKKDAQAALDKAKENLIAAQAEYDARWGRAKNKGGLTPEKRAAMSLLGLRNSNQSAALQNAINAQADVQMLRDINGASQKKLTPEEFKSIKEAGAKILVEKAAEKAAKKAKEHPEEVVTAQADALTVNAKPEQKIGARTPFFAPKHNKHVEVKRELDVKLSEAQRSGNRHVKNDDDQRETAVYKR